MNAPNSSIDLDAYFERIGYDGPREASLDTLAALHRLHPQTIPFENLDALLGRPVRLDPQSIQQKLVGARRGGYCFEHNLLFRGALDALGFTTRSLAARVVWGRTDPQMPARTHMLLLVDLEGVTYLADVGFGGVTLTAPLVFETGRDQVTPHEPFRIDAIDANNYLLQVKLDDTWAPLYRFDLEPQFDIDYELANHFVATHPQSIFVSNLLVARVAAHSRYAMFNRRLTVYGPDPSQRELTTVDALRDVLQNEIGIRLPDDANPALDAMLARLP
ncbi:arylamine N-acetyltransferase family protein [Caballeronia telluris]|uniref:N-hydroxyarylamine O-acetyltransferase n=1 Tax=Caballeronia telluris TaxID=326475 RepID=A0A158FZW8_9BURK|nr:arylamine N-acetyltransferase [Caballeronia telluris]SAL24899.1 N-hydroxyarylamine O-acetyltransferase [Caballeronia telluris]